MESSILVIEDNQEFLKRYIKRFLQEGFQAEGFDNVRFALENFQQKRYDVIVLDLIIPGLRGQEEGGMDVIEQALKIDPLIQIIVVTAYGTIKRFQKTLKEGAFWFIEKRSPDFMDELVDTIRLSLLKRDQKIRQGNPFIPQSNHMPRFFGGRKNEISFLEERLARALRKTNPVNEHFVILGEWGIGKSTLLKKYKEIANEKEFLGVYVSVVEFSNYNTVGEGISSIIQGIFREIPFAASRLEQVSGYFKSIGINILGTGLQFTKDSQSLQPESIFYDTLKELWQDVSERKLMLILLDDVQNFAAIAPILMTMRQIIEGTSIKDLPIVFGLSCTVSHWKAFTDHSQYNPVSRTFFKKIMLSRLSEQEVQDTIINSLKDTRVLFSEEIIRQVYAYTKGHPFEVQALCQRLFDNQVGGKVSMEVWEKSLQQTTMDMGEYIFEHWYRKLSDKETMIFKVLSNSKDPMRLKDIQHAVVEQDIPVDINEVPEIVQDFIDKGLVDFVRDSNELLEIPDQIFKSYIQFRSYKTS